MAVFWVITLRVGTNNFGGTCCFHFHNTHVHNPEDDSRRKATTTKVSPVRKQHAIEAVK